MKLRGGKENGICGNIDGPSNWKPDPNAAKNVRAFIEKGGNTDSASNAIQGRVPEGF